MGVEYIAYYKSKPSDVMLANVSKELTLLTCFEYRGYNDVCASYNYRFKSKPRLEEDTWPDFSVMVHSDHLYVVFYETKLTQEVFTVLDQLLHKSGIDFSPFEEP